MNPELKNAFTIVLLMLLLIFPFINELGNLNYRCFTYFTAIKQLKEKYNNDIEQDDPTN